MGMQQAQTAQAELTKACTPQARNEQTDGAAQNNIFGFSLPIDQQTDLTAKTARQGAQLARLL